MTTAMGTNSDVATYIAAVRSHLDDLPADEREDVLDDLQAHLAEVAAESDEPLVRRLGPPDLYAAELRASAGYGAPARPAAGVVHRVVDRMRAQGAAADRSVPELRPAWWVLRGPVVALAVVVMWERRHYGGGRVPLAAVLDGVTLLLTVAAIAVSVRLGRRSVERPALSSAANAVGLLAIAAILAWTTPSFAREASYAPSLGPPGVLTAPDGHPVFNVYPFSADGSPLDNVLLYDQDGRPLESGAFVSEDGSQAPPKYPPDANGNPVVNAYPRQAPSPGPVAPARRPAVRIPPPIPTTTTPPAG